MKLKNILVSSALFSGLLSVLPCTQAHMLEKKKVSLAATAELMNFRQEQEMQIRVERRQLSQLRESLEIVRAEFYEYKKIGAHKTLIDWHNTHEDVKLLKTKVFETVQRLCHLKQNAIRRPLSRLAGIWIDSAARLYQEIESAQLDTLHSTFKYEIEQASNYGELDKVCTTYLEYTKDLKSDFTFVEKRFNELYSDQHSLRITLLCGAARPIFDRIVEIAKKESKINSSDYECVKIMEKTLDEYFATACLEIDIMSIGPRCARVITEASHWLSEIRDFLAQIKSEEDA